MEEQIKQLVQAYGPSGFEDQIRAIIESAAREHADDISVDALGNLIAFKKGDGSGLRVMVAAHMDEIGVMVTHVTEKGFLRFTNIGAVFPLHILGARVQFADGTLGIIYSDRNDSWQNGLPLDKHYIDVGASSREECAIQVGMAAAFKRSFEVQGSRVIAKSMDDRIGCFVALQALRNLGHSPHDVYFVFSVQEEVGTRGAQAAANGILPDVGIAIDVTMTGDTPKARGLAVDLGQGPAIKVKDKGMIAHGGLVREMRARAQENEIKCQLEVLVVGSTDARSMQIAGPGSAAGCISIPCRYVHSQSEIVDLNDVENAITLLTSILAKPLAL